MNEKYQTLKLLKQNEYADVYTIDGETDKPQGLVVTPDNKLRYFGDKAGYDKEYIIVLPNTPKAPVDLFKTQEHKEMTTFEGTLKRAREGNALSQNLLGIWILNSQLPDGVEVNEDPFELIRLSAEQGFPTAQYNMGVIHETGCLGGKVADAKDEKLAFAWYRKAANQGCAAAMAAVGICLYNGVGTEPNLSDALSWLKEAATQGEQRGQLFLAEILAKDERCCDKNEALYWFCQLARHESLRNPELRGFVF